LLFVAQSFLLWGISTVLAQWIKNGGFWPFRQACAVTKKAATFWPHHKVLIALTRMIVGLENW
jgi:hypothetical protein